MSRLTLFAKGNADLHDPLHSCRIAGELRWNGINEIVRARHPGTVVRLVHETCTRWDAVLAATGRIPPEVDRDVPLGVYPLRHQFSDAVFAGKADAVILSAQPDIGTGLLRHRATGTLFYPSEFASWPEDARIWVRADFERLPPPSPETSMGNLAAVIERVRAARDVPVLVANVSSLVPGEVVHWYQGVGETFTTRARRFNVMLTDLCEATGACLVDVETLIGRAGADWHKQDAMHLTPEGHRLVAEEIVRILEDMGLLQQDEAA